jgi:hypothetical protein
MAGSPAAGRCGTGLKLNEGVVIGRRGGSGRKGGLADGGVDRGEVAFTGAEITGAASRDASFGNVSFGDVSLAISFAATSSSGDSFGSLEMEGGNTPVAPPAGQDKGATVTGATVGSLSLGRGISRASARTI